MNALLLTLALALVAPPAVTGVYTNVSIKKVAVGLDTLVVAVGWKNVSDGKGAVTNRIVNVNGVGPTATKTVGAGSQWVQFRQAIPAGGGFAVTYEVTAQICTVRNAERTCVGGPKKVIAYAAPKPPAVTGVYVNGSKVTVP